MAKRNLLRFTSLALIMLASLSSGHAGNFSATEIQLKIALLYNFAKFVDWPEQKFQTATSPVILCIYAEEQYALAALSVNGKPVQKNRNMSVVGIGNEGDMSNCHILFISRSFSINVEEISDSLAKMPILTVGETNDFIRHGGVINLIEVNNKIRFEINLKAAESLSLTISSKLLRLANEIY